MSHFAVMVVTDHSPTMGHLSDVLQPFHEFECTGVDDEFVEDIDITEERREEFSKATTRRFLDPDGGAHSPYADCFYRDWTSDELADAGRGGVAPMGSGTSGGLVFYSKDWGDGRGYRSKVHYLPHGWRKENLPTSEVMSFRDWLMEWSGTKAVAPGTEPDLTDADAHKYGYALVDAAGEVIKVIKRTNPRAKWDGWRVGGRYGGRLAPGYDPRKDPANLETCWLCHGTGMRNDEIGRAARLADPSYTCNNCSGAGKSIKFESKWRDVGNQCRVGDLDLAGMKATRVAERRAMVDEINTKFGEDTLDELEAAYRAYKAAHAVWLMLEPRPYGAERDEWLKTQPNGEAASRYHKADLWRSIEPADGQTIAEWIEAAPALSTWAVLKDGEWFEKGEMGWFGMSTGDKPDWGDQFEQLLAGLRPDQWVTIVDCHT